MTISNTTRQDVRTSGITLPEVLITVLILGILAAISLDSGLKMRRREQINSLTVTLSGWIEEVRRSSQRGVGCTVTIGGSNLSPGSQFASSAIRTSATTTITDSNACLSLDPLVIPGSFAGNRGTFSVSSATFTLTPRGTVTYTSGTSVSIIISQTGNPDSRCLRLSGLLGLMEISKGSGCGSQERF